MSFIWEHRQGEQQLNSQLSSTGPNGCTMTSLKVIPVFRRSSMKLTMSEGAGESDRRCDKVLGQNDSQVACHKRSDNMV